MFYSVDMISQMFPLKDRDMQHSPYLTLYWNYNTASLEILLKRTVELFCIFRSNFLTPYKTILIFMFA